MRLTLASYLSAAVTDMRALKEKVEPSAFVSWCDRYQSQVVVLAAQILW